MFNRSKYGMFLTDSGQKLYMQIKDSVNILNKAELIFNESRDINLGSHINMLSRMFSNAISTYYKEVAKSTINVTNDTFSNMITMLELLKTEDIIRIITKEYIKNELEINKLSVLKTDFTLEPIEFGIYYNIENRFKEQNMLRSFGS